MRCHMSQIFEALKLCAHQASALTPLDWSKTHLIFMLVLMLTLILCVDVATEVNVLLQASRLASMLPLGVNRPVRAQKEAYLYSLCQLTRTRFAVTL